MEDRLKELFDSFEQDEVDELLKDIKTDDIKTDEPAARRIRNNVLKKTNTAHRRINRKIITIAASAAVLVISVGIIGLVRNNTPKTSESEAPTAVYGEDEAPAAEEMPTYEMVADDMPEDYAEEAEAPEDPDTIVSKNAGSASKDNAPGSIVDSSSSERAGYASNSESDMMEYKNMESSEIEKTLDEAEYLEDYTGFLDVYHVTLSDIEKDSDYVVRGTKMGSSFVASIDPIDRNLKLVADFNIDEDMTRGTETVLSGKITVNEGIYYMPEYDAFESCCKYSHMKTGKTYILFLKKASDGKYDIIGQLYGKIPVDPNEKLYLGTETDDEKIEGNLRDYIDIVKNVRKQYISDNNKSNMINKNTDEQVTENETAAEGEDSETPDITEPEDMPETTPEALMTEH